MKESRHRGRITVLGAMSSHSLIGPSFFNQTINSKQHLHMLQNDFLLQLSANGLPLHTQWFMQDGAAPHTANSVLDLNTVFGPHVISNHHLDHHNCGNFGHLLALT
jgi:hypothetical protein